jgi:hypothetical protein
MSTPLLITARLDSPIAADAPRLDALLMMVLSLHYAKTRPGYKIDRSLPAPPQDEIAIPLLRERLGPWSVARCSDPIYGVCSAEYVEHVTKRIAAEEAELLHPDRRVVISTTNSWTKSYRLPLRMRRIDCVYWFALAERRALLKTLRRVDYLGKKRSVGNGRVASWEATAVEEDHSWFAPSPAGPVLMATLPAGPWLPHGLVGFRAGFGGCCPPYWHPDRYAEIVVPC